MKPKVEEALPINSGLSMVTSRFELENEIDRQFGALGGFGGLDATMKDESAMSRSKLDILAKQQQAGSDAPSMFQS